MSGRYDWFVNRVNLICRPLNASGRSATVVVAAKDFGREGFPRDFCPGSNFARGFHGRSGVYVDRVGLICHTGGTPNLQAAPDAIIAVNLIDPQTGPITTVPTPFVLFQWTDHSTAETGFRIRINALSGGFQRSIDRPAAPGVGSRQAVTISDLPFGGYGVKVCATFQGSAELCNPLALLVFGIGPGLGSPTDVFFERAGTGQATAHWTYNFSNPTQFDVRLHCDSPPGAEKSVATTFDGRARQRNFNFVGFGLGTLRVCAQYPSQSPLGFCSALVPFPCD